MSVLAQLASVATITAAIVATPLLAWVLFGVTAVLTLSPFILATLQS